MKKYMKEFMLVGAILCVGIGIMVTVVLAGMMSDSVGQINQVASVDYVRALVATVIAAVVGIGVFIKRNYWKR